MARFAITLVLTAIFLGTFIPLAAAEEVKCEGAITRIEGDKIAVKTMSAEQQMLIEPATKIVINGKPADPTELKIGQKVKCICDKRDGKVICTSIEVESKCDAVG